MAARFFDNQPFVAGQQFELGDAASHHISKVLRMNRGDALLLFNGTGGEWQAVIEEVRKKTVVVEVTAFTATNRQPPLAARLLLPLLKADRLDYALQKSVELGVSAIQLLITERTEGRFSHDKLEKKMQHWQQVIISACEQCGLNILPDLLPPLRLADVLSEMQNTPSLKLIAHPGEQPLSQRLVLNANKIDLLTGPEGGFSTAEITLAQAAGFQCFALGERVLRAETAPPVLLAALWAIREFPAA